MLIFLSRTALGRLAGRQGFVAGWVCLLLWASAIFIPNASAWAQNTPPAVSASVVQLFSEDFGERVQALEQLAAHSDAQTETVLRAAQDDCLKRIKGQVWLQGAPEGGQWLTGDLAAAAPPEADLAQAESPTLNNRLRGILASALGAYDLLSPDASVRQQAITSAFEAPADLSDPVLALALNKESAAPLRQQLEILQAMRLVIQASPETPAGAWQSGLATLAAAAQIEVQSILRQASHNEALSAVQRQQAQAALDQYVSRHQRAVWVNNVFSGLSAASILLLVALGLAITYGLMGVINMAHGEFLMIGAYATYVTQEVLRGVAPQYMDQYIWFAIPVSFVSAAGVGMLIEWLVLRHLYGKPVDSLLATFGISLILMQATRTLFGAQNVEVANPSWLSGAQEPLQHWLPGLQLLNSRIAVLVFALAVLVLVWVILTRTRLGLFVRAVTQNRRMAACVGVRTRRIDNLAFGLGTGIAGLGGCALSQISNVGPDMGQGHIIDSFLVVVLGGVGQLAGTLLASVGLGVGSKLSEPLVGAVLTKIGILVLIVLFIQKRPQGLFALKGRSAEA